MNFQEKLTHCGGCLENTPAKILDDLVQRGISPTSPPLFGRKVLERSGRSLRSLPLRDEQFYAVYADRIHRIPSSRGAVNAVRIHRMRHAIS